MKKEPAVLVAIVVWLLMQGIDALKLPTPVDPQLVQGIAELLIAIGGALIVRSKTLTKRTVKEAGLSPAQVIADAEERRAAPG